MRERRVYEGVFYYSCYIRYYLTASLLYGLWLSTNATDISVAQIPTKKREQTMTALAVTSTVFEHNQSIPTKYTCDGEDISPPLRWEGAPEHTKSFVLICDDPDAPMDTWVHWVVFNIPATVTSFAEGVDPTTHGASIGQNSWGTKKQGYGGPCPPSGTHRYFFKFYALDIEKLDLGAAATKQDVEQAMEGHIIAQGELMGTYARAR